MLNIVIPMAGKGSRFSVVGYDQPKPFIDVKGKPMIQVVVENLKPTCEHKFIFICQSKHLEKYNAGDLLVRIAPGCEILGIDGVTEGAACTVLKAEKYINNDCPLMIANSDQYIDININDYLAGLESKEMDGLIMTMTAEDPKWSFVCLDEVGNVVDVKEKQVISNEATVGIYNFKKGSDFCIHAKNMIRNKELQNGEYYVAPVYTRFIRSGGQVKIYNIGSEASGMYGLGTPSDLDKFLSLPISNNL